MQFELSSELTLMREALRKFVKAELQPLEKAIDAGGELPPQVLPLLGKHGYLSMRLPVDVGGAGMGLFPYCLMLEEFSRSHRIFGLLAGGGGGLTPMAIARHGTPQQRRKYLTGLMDGTVRTAFASSQFAPQPASAVSICASAHSRNSPRSHSRCGVCSGRLGASTTPCGKSLAAICRSIRLFTPPAILRSAGCRKASSNKR